jgi:hypothetical protein
MSICRDKSTTFLRDLGYNVVRHPTARISPLDLIGVQKGESLYLGHLNQLVGAENDGLPEIERNVKSAEIRSEESSRMSIAIGANILGNLIGALGGNLGVRTSYTDAQRISFAFKNVLNDLVVPLDVGDYLREAQVDAANLILQQYVLGRGVLYLITRTVKSREFTVRYERKNQTDASVDVRVLKDLVGTNVEVEAAAERSSVISFSGRTPLVFGFQCFRVGVSEGDLALTSVRAGNVSLAADRNAAEKPDLLADEGPVDLNFSV